MVEYVVYFVYFVYSVYFVYFGMVEYSTFCTFCIAVYRTRVEYCTFCVVRRSFQALFHITPSSFITKCQKKNHLLAITLHPSKPLDLEAS